MNMQDRLQEALIEQLSKQQEASYSRIYQHTQDDSTFAIIGSEDKDTGENRKRELYDLLKKYKESDNYEKLLFCHISIICYCELLFSIYYCK